MSSLTEVGSFGLLDINIASAASLAIFNPLLAQFDLALTGQFGLGALQADISAQFNAALSVQVSVGLQISNPLAGLQASLSAIGQLAAGLQAAIALGVPTINAQLSADVAAAAALTAVLGIKLGGISALIELAASLKIPAVNFIADLSASLNAGPVVLLSFGYPSNEPLSSVGAQAQALLSTGLTGIAPGDGVAGIMLITKAPAAKAGISALLKTS
jgi:hypothetical protein